MTPIAPTTAASVSAAPKADAPDPKLVKAAKDFEAIFLRQMLKQLEKTTAAGCGAQASAGQGTYGSMIVDSVAESISKAGGLGLADVIAKSLAVEHPSLTQAKATQAATPPTPASLYPTLKPLK